MGVSWVNECTIQRRGVWVDAAFPHGSPNDFGVLGGFKDRLKGLVEFVQDAQLDSDRLGGGTHMLFGSGFAAGEETEYRQKCLPERQERKRETHGLYWSLSLG